MMWREFHLINSFTLECSFCGPSNQDNKNPFNDCHFNISLLKELGRDFCKTLLDYARDENKVKLALAELELLSPNSNSNTMKGQGNSNNSGACGSGSKSNLLDDEEGCGAAIEEEPDFERMTEDRVSNTETTPFDVECNDITTKFFKNTKKMSMVPTKSFVSTTGRVGAVTAEEFRKIKESKKS